MSIYRISLFPIDSYFFGSNKLGELGNRQDYFISSDKFPQQTTVLGMLRYQLLLQNNCLKQDEWKIRDKDKADQLVGKTSFQPSIDKYGCIKKLSPVFVCKEEADYYLCDHFKVNNENLDKSEEESKQAQATKLINEEGYSENLLATVISDYKGEGQDVAWKFDHFTEKKDWRKQFINQAGGLVHETKIFSEEIQAHNHKSLRGTSFEQAYFKERRYRLARQYGFSFYAEIDSLENEPPVLKSNIVRLGGRQSWFKMQIESKESYPDFDTHFYRKNNSEKQVLLLSDACMAKDFKHKCMAVAGTTISFKNLITNNQKTNNFHDLKHKESSNEPYMSEYQYLLKRGTVLYLRDEFKAADLFDTDAPGFPTIGYNQFMSI